MTDTLPAEQLVQRNDPEWEDKCSRKRIEAARVFALRVMTRILAVQMTCNPDVKTDDDFSALVDELYDGLRDRLTRQDLLMAFVEPLNKLAWPQAERIVAQVQRDLRKMTET